MPVFKIPNYLVPKGTVTVNWIPKLGMCNVDVSVIFKLSMIQIRQETGGCSDGHLELVLSVQ